MPSAAIYSYHRPLREYVREWSDEYVPLDSESRALLGLKGSKARRRTMSAALLELLGLRYTVSRSVAGVTFSHVDRLVDRRYERRYLSIDHHLAAVSYPLLVIRTRVGLRRARDLCPTEFTQLLSLACEELGWPPSGGASAAYTAGMRQALRPTIERLGSEGWLPLAA